MDEVTTSKLTAWGFEEFIPKFADEGVDYAALINLTEPMVEKLIPKLGQQAKFISYIKKEKERCQVLEDTPIVFTSTPLSLLSTVPTSLRSEESFSETAFSVGEEGDNRSDETIVSIRKRKYKSQVANFELRVLLESDCIGQAILSIYDTKKNIEPKYQIYLSQIIANYFLNKRSEYGRLTNDCFEDIAWKIKELFPEEEVETYYVTPIRKSDSRNDKSGIARGKLPDKYKNILTLLKEAGVIPKKKKCWNTVSVNQPLVSVDTIVQESIDASREWLENNTQPLETVLSHWVATFSYRRQQISAEKINTLQEIFNEWPILKHSCGYLLIEKDFDLLYPEKVNAIHKFKWLFETSVKCRNNSVSSEDAILFDLLESASLSEDCKNVIRFYLLTSILPPKSVKVKKWKPTTAESRRGVIITVKVAEEIYPAIEAKRNEMKKYGLTVQPFIVIEAPSITEIKNIYVIIDETHYEVPSVLKALEVCFKTFLVLNARYPPEAEHLWTLLQWGMFEITTSYDAKQPYVLDFLKKIKKYKE